VSRPVNGTAAVLDVDAFERWSYGEGFTDGRADGIRDGFTDGYRAGFDAGIEVGGARLLLAVEAGLGGRLPQLLPDLPHTGGYRCYRQRTAASDEPCPGGCGRCTACIRAAAAAANRAATGRPDFPGLRPGAGAGCGVAGGWS
jgi:hypothetical protein